MSESISQLPDEPNEKDPACTTISFWAPDGSQFTRWFLKSHKVRSMYDYVISLGTEVGFEHEHAQFKLIQNFPNTVYSDMS